ncbi:MAG: 2-isopropylmalate synthase [Candidatus Nanohalarchaeota archaeon]|nr:MAG: 2-isopropylmalate synthase [Candidatus Nanohaloarchaeota archaeon]
MGKRNIEIFDTTLRDGEQSPGATLTIDEKLKIAHQLAKLNIDTMEAGFPIASNDDFEAVKLIAENVDGPYICGLCRTVEKDIQKAWDAVKYSSKPCIHTFIATSDLHLKYKLKKTRDEALEMAKKGVKLAKSFTDRVEFSAEDASRTDKDYLCKIIQAVIDEGAVVVNIPDTVGYAQPNEFGDLIDYIKQNVENIDDAIISVHCHNDLGLAVVNSLEAVRRGAGQVEGTINGIGERAGNAALEEVIMNFKTRPDYFNCDTGINTKEIYSASKMVAGYTGIHVQRNKAIVGENAFAHEAGIHQHGVLSNPLCYEIMNPETIGKKTELVFGKHSGKHAIEDGLKKLNYKFSPGQLSKITQKIKDLADKQKTVLEEDIIAIADYELNKSSKKQTVVLEELSIISGNKITPTAVVKVNLNGTTKTSSAYGVGVLDASTKAIRNILGPDVKFKEYELKAITGGSDALADVSLTLMDKSKKKYNARAIDSDIVMASVKAVINGMNKIEREKNKKSD